MYKTEKFSSNDFSPARFEAQGEIILNGQKISYHTVSEDNVFYNNEGKPIASIFSYSYFRKDVKDDTVRPVIFCYNGGPGSSALYVHAGFLGTKRIKYGELDRPTALPPYEVIDNPDCLLDIADIVFVDPVGTGYGLLLDDNEEKTFFGVEEDAEALLMFIEKWISRYNRWRSPKYLIGESYGCTRSATAAGIAVTRGSEYSYNIAFDGIVMIGNTVTVGKYFGREIPVEAAVLSFPTWASINWFHNHPTSQLLEEFAMEAKHFADTEYLLALYQGDALQGEEREKIIKKLCYYTGVSRDYLEERSLRIDDKTFRTEVVRDRNITVARFDGRITRPQYKPWIVEDAIGMRDDASTDRYGAYFLSALNGVIFPSLNISLDRVYISSYRMKNPDTGKDKWNREAPMGTTGEQLRNAMIRTPGMRTFFANGWYDTATHIGTVYYTLDHAGLPLDRVTVKGYPSGHMIYIGEDNVKELCDDIRCFINGGMPGKVSGL